MKAVDGQQAEGIVGGHRDETSKEAADHHPVVGLRAPHQ